MPPILLLLALLLAGPGCALFRDSQSTAVSTPTKNAVSQPSLSDKIRDVVASADAILEQFDAILIKVSDQADHKSAAVLFSEFTKYVSNDLFDVAEDKLREHALEELAKTFSKGSLTAMKSIGLISEVVDLSIKLNNLNAKVESLLASYEQGEVLKRYIKRTRVDVMPIMIEVRAFAVSDLNDLDEISRLQTEVLNIRAENRSKLQSLEAETKSLETALHTPR